jgi:hypothetical protein
LDVIEIERQILVRAHIGTKDLGDHFLIGGAIEHLALVTILDAQHFLAVGLVTSAFAPEIGRLDGRHQELDGAGAVLLLAHDPANLVEHAQPKRQEGVNPGRLLAHHAGAQHQAMRDDLRFLRCFAQNGQEVSGKAHEISSAGRVETTFPAQ